MHEEKDEEILPLRCSSAVAAEYATTAACALSGGGSTACTNPCGGGEFRALCAGDGREARKKRMNAEGGERLPRSPYLLTVEEIVARDSLRTIPVTDGDNHPTISARFLQRLNCRTIGHTMDHKGIGRAHV